MGLPDQSGHLPVAQEPLGKPDLGESEGGHAGALERPVFRHFRNQSQNMDQYWPKSSSVSPGQFNRNMACRKRGT